MKLKSVIKMKPVLFNLSFSAIFNCAHRQHFLLRSNVTLDSRNPTGGGGLDLRLLSPVLTP